MYFLVALFAIAAAAPDQSELYLAKKEPHTIRDVSKICNINSQDTYNRQNYDVSFTNEYETLSDIVERSQRQVRKIQNCCQKESYDTVKQCLKHVRRNYLNDYCDNAPHTICCKTSNDISRYTCFAKTPLRLSLNPTVQTPFDSLLEREILDETTTPSTSQLWRLENTIEQAELLSDEEDLFDSEVEKLSWSSSPRKYWSTMMEDDDEFSTPFIRKNPFSVYTTPSWKQQQSYENKIALLSTLKEQELQYETESEYDNYGSYNDEKYTTLSNVDRQQKRRQLKQATSLAADQVCSQTLKPFGQRQTQKCCQAGKLVGEVTQTKSLCRRALEQFKNKAQGCNVKHNEQCKEAFYECCKQQSQQSRMRNVAERQIDIEMTKQIVEDEQDVMSDVFNRKYNTFY